MRGRHPPWYIECDRALLQYAFFISHVSEDTDQVRKLKSKIASISRRGGGEALDCFLDFDCWLKGNVSSEVIKESLLKSEYLVCWITPAYLRNRRGWIWMEFAYAELLELSLNYRELGTRFPYIVPVFQGVTMRQADRTPLHAYVHRNLPGPLGKTSPIPTIARELVDFYDQERRRRSGPGPPAASP